MTTLPDGWMICALKDSCALLTDGTHHSPTNTPSGDFRYVTAKNIRRWGLDLSDITYVDQETHAAIYKRAPVQKGDVLYIKDGATTGLAAINTLDEPFSLLSSVALLRPLDRLLDSDFLKYWLNSPVTLDAMVGRMSGSAIRRLTLTAIGAQEIAIPPLAEQRRIVAKLDALVARSKHVRADLDRITALVARAKQAILEKALGEDQSLGAGWTRSELGALLDDIRYGTAKKCDYGAGAIGVLRIPNVQRGEITLDDLKHADFEESELKKLSLHKGDMLVIRSNGSVDLVGRCAVVPSTAVGLAFAGYLIRLRPKPEQLDSRFLSHLFASPAIRRQIALEAKSTSGVHNINSEQIKSLEVSLPPLEEQAEIVRRIEAAFGKIDRMAAETASASKLLNRLDLALLAKAFRGELVPQDPNDEPAVKVLERIKAARSQQHRNESRRARATSAPKSPREKAAMTKSRQDDDVKNKPYLADIIRRVGGSMDVEKLFATADLSVPDFYKQLAWELDLGHLCAKANRVLEAA